MELLRQQFLSQCLLVPLRWAAQGGSRPPTPWGELFKSYGDGQVVMPGMEPKTVVQAALGLGTLAAMLGLGAWWLRKKAR